MQIENLYNNVLLKSRNINLFKNCYIDDTLENKIILFIIYFSFIFNKLKKKKTKKNQLLFDYIFNRIESDLRELGLGDMSINKKMKLIINKFYSILLNFDNYLFLSCKQKIKLIDKILVFKSNHNRNYKNLIKYLDNYVKKIDLISFNDIYSSNF